MGALLAVLLCLATNVRAQGVIELRAVARVPSGLPVLLGDVAQLFGADAEALAEVVVRSSAGAGDSISIEDVRRAINRSGRVHWGRLSLRGSTCRLEETVRAEPVGPAVPGPIAPVSSNPAGTVRAIVIDRISTIAQAPREEMRLTFAPEDDDLLELPVAGRTVEVTPTGLSDRLPLAVRIFEGERIVRNRTIRVGVEVRRGVVIAAASRRRGETISESDITQETQWLGLAARPATVEQVIGASPRSRVSAGQVVMADDVAAPLVVNKGEQVTVYCVQGTFVVTVRARALAAGRDGELVQFEALDSRRTFLARMDGRGRAVINGAGEPRALPGEQ